MIKDIISFETAGRKFVIDFLKTPIILRAKDYLDSTQAGSGLNYEKIQFENETVELIDLANILELGSSMFMDTSRILVGEVNGMMFGLLVDKVVEIISLKGEDEDYEDTISAKQYIEVSGENLRLIDVDQLLRNANLNINMG